MVVLADDATGALETGALLAPCPVWLEIPEETITAPAVIDTESRHVSPSEAAALIRAAARRLPARARVFKKIDSTLRGNVAAEVQALAKAFPGRRIVVAPAYPKFGRTVREGVLLVNGVPVSKTVFGSDARSPVRESSLRALLQEFTVCDAETEADLTRIAATCGDDCIAVGSGGLARVMLPGREAARVSEVRDWTVVCGSLHPASLRQAEVARAAGIDVLQGENAGALAAYRIHSGTAGGLIVFGGDTAYQTLRALGRRVVNAIGEVLPGVPVCLAGETPVITKAGGFGGDDLIADILRKVKRTA